MITKKTKILNGGKDTLFTYHLFGMRIWSVLWEWPIFVAKP